MKIGWKKRPFGMRVVNNSEYTGHSEIYAPASLSVFGIYSGGMMALCAALRNIDELLSLSGHILLPGTV